MSSDSQTTAARDLQNILASHDSKDPEVKQLESMANNFTSTPTQKKTLLSPKSVRSYTDEDYDEEYVQMKKQDEQEFQYRREQYKAFKESTFDLVFKPFIMAASAAFGLSVGYAFYDWFSASRLNIFRSK